MNWFNPASDIPIDTDRLTDYSLQDQFQAILKLRNSLSEALSSPATLNQLKQDKQKAELVFETSKATKDFLQILGSDKREFFFGCNILFLTLDEIAQRRAPVTTVTFELPSKTNEDGTKTKGKATVRVFKTTKLKCMRCQLY